MIILKTPCPKPYHWQHLHPNDLGMQAMANAIPLALFRSSGAALAPAGQKLRK